MHATAATMTALADQELFTRLIDEHAGIIRKVAFGYTSTSPDREDLSRRLSCNSGAPTRATRRSGRSPPGCIVIALNVAISFLRRRTHPVRQTIPLKNRNLPRKARPRRRPTNVFPILRQLIAALAPLDRALMLLYLDDRSYREIAAILGLTETNVATKINRLKERVRDQMLKLNRQQP